MKYIKFAVAGGTVIAALLSPGVSKAATTTTCAPVKVSNINTATPSTNQVAYTFNVPGQGQPATAQVKAGAACVDQEVSLVSYKAPAANGQPLTNQIINDSQTKLTTSGVVDFTVQVPNCYYQVDLVYGQPLDLSTGQTYSSQHRLIDAANGGNQTCNPGMGGGTPTPTLTPTVSNIAAAVPATPAPLAAATQVPTTLPNTGSTMTVVEFIFSILVAATVFIVSRKRQQLYA